MDELFPPRTIQSSTWGNHPTQALASSVVAIQGAEPSSTIRVCTIMLTVQLLILCNEKPRSSRLNQKLQ